jgi:hypothetical protein
VKHLILDEAAVLELPGKQRDRTTGPADQEDRRPLLDLTDLQDEDFHAVLTDHLPELPAAGAAAYRP